MLYSEKLKYLRERNGLTQNQAGLLINLDSGTYCHYETEELLIPIKHLNTLANYYNVSIDYLFSFNDVFSYSRSKKEIDRQLTKIRLKELRKEQKLSQDKLSKVLNVARSTIAEYERGTNIIATPFLYTICSKYEISADYLLGIVDKPKYLK